MTHGISTAIDGLFPGLAGAASTESSGAPGRMLRSSHK